jgi:hypothetical protein
MPTRLRAVLGAILFALGIACGFGGPILGPLPVKIRLFWIGLGLMVLGVAIVLWAIRDVVRQISATEIQFEAKLRAELESRKGEKPPPSAPGP